MKTLLLVASLIFCAQAISQEEVLKQWQEYQVKYGKVYASEELSKTRLNAFVVNLEKIESHNKLFDEGKTTWTMGVNEFSDLTAEEWADQFLTTFPAEMPEPIDIFTEHNKTNPEADVSDWRTKGAVTGIKNQASCGSCWSFSATGGLEGQYKIHKGSLPSLSEQFFVDCTYAKPRDGCKGGWMNEAWNMAAKKSGVPTESSYPYKAKSGACQNKAGSVKVAGAVAVAANDAALTKAIGSIGPISVAFNAALLQNYKSGIVSGTCDPKKPTHAVLAIGYGTSNGVNYYLLKNQWGANWGEKGYFRMRRGNNQCGVANWASYPKLK